MMNQSLIELFSEKAVAVGAEVISCTSIAEAATFVAGKVDGPLLVPTFPSGCRSGLETVLRDAGLDVLNAFSSETAGRADGGLTGTNFAIADTGSLVLESTAEDIRLATTLPPKQFALLDPAKIVADGLAAVDPMRRLHQRDARNYIAYITGPSRTADIERVLTIGVHGPKELFILLVPGFSSDFLEM